MVYNIHFCMWMSISELYTSLCLHLGDIYRLSQYHVTYWDSYGSLSASYKDDECNEKVYGQVQVDVQQCSLVE